MRIKIPFIKSTSDCPIVKFMLGNGTAGYALIDTGSEITLADENFVKDNKSCFKVDVTKDKIVMHGAMGSNEKPVVNALANLSFCINDDLCGYQISAILGDLTHIRAFGKGGKTYNIAVILGSDFLTENKAKINFINSQLSLEQ